MLLTIDHVTIAGSVLEPLRQSLADRGLTTEYGGPHSNGITHMALLGFDDGSYLELISSLKPGQIDETDAFWGQHIIADGGPCAWAIRVDDIETEANRVAALGIPVQGPAYYHRQSPTGRLVEWELAFLGAKGAGTQLPFLIRDITPRAWRVRPSASVAGGPLTGVAVVILGVKDLAETIALFQQVYGWPGPLTTDSTRFGARLAYFQGGPVVLATPLASDKWLARRLNYFGESPCAYLIAASDFATARRRFRLTQTADFFGQPVAWFDPDKSNGLRLGVVGQ